MGFLFFLFFFCNYYLVNVIFLWGGGFFALFRFHPDLNCGVTPLTPIHSSSKVLLYI